ncbi:C40 family peptidase [Parvularcula dongshanensis]|uniref:Cell wall-associated NlpC family hydrolase n=1 Tax=Parvularcula dongshanensis TaxID=1173995 RepID=A0A840HZF6_9PROT|nr:NlpC/P60 family protein [Parvularcula dongshanensis]MBB4657949.1 cell wall-associated NlpC family hydrolase [Parvularcula dongshanensis]
MTDRPQRDPAPGAPGTRPDPFSARLTPARPDVAADYLRGKVEADRFVRGEGRQVTAAAAAIRREPRADAMQETQILFGEVFTVYDEADGWAWGQAALDGYVGYVEAADLSARIDTPTHRVAALRTLRFPRADLKAPPLCLLSMNAKLTVTDRSEDGKYLRDSRGGWVFADHLLELGRALTDPVAAAERFMGAPYFWGGRESLGLDCSGLIQNAYEVAGVVVPRDADMQEVFLSAPERGEELWQRRSGGDWQGVALRRGDLVYWVGHTGIMVDEARLLHANATHMAVTIDPLLAMAEHLNRAKDNPVTRIVRPKAPADMLIERTGL